jgi:hypothetical protein
VRTRPTTACSGDWALGWTFLILSDPACQRGVVPAPTVYLLTWFEPYACYVGLYMRGRPLHWWRNSRRIPLAVLPAALTHDRIGAMQPGYITT